MFIYKIILVMFLWALCFPLITIGLPFAPHLSFAALRALIAGALLLSIAVFLRRPMPTTLAVWSQLLIIGAGATTLGFLGMFHAAEFVSPGMATVIANTQPLLAAVLAHYLLGERINAAGRWSLALGFGGILIIALPHLTNGASNNYAIGIAYIVLAALGITISNVWIKKMSCELDSLVTMGWQLVIGGVLLALMAGFTEDPSTIVWTGEFLFSLLGLSTLGTALAFWLWYDLLQQAPLTRANAFMFLVPIFGITIGVSFYNEVLTWWAIIGVGATMVGIYIFGRSSITEIAR